MSVSCKDIATGTTTVEITTQSLSTTSSATVTTESPTTITSTITIPCTPSPTSGTVIPTCNPITSTTVITSPGSTRTTFVPVTVPVPITATSTNTLWGSSCTTITTPNNNGGYTPPPSSPTPTPPAVITSASSSTQPNGSVVTVIKTLTSSGGSSSTGTVQNTDSNNPTSNIAPIVGGAVGGFFGLIAIVVLVWFFVKRRQRWNDIWETDEDIAASLGNKRPHEPLQGEVEPKPYEYGLVGKAQPPTSSPPQSPPFGPTRPEHGRTPSMAPLLTPMSAAQTLGSVTTVSSRPSTGGSTHQLTTPLNPVQAQMQQAHMYPQRPDLAHANTSMSHAHSTSNASMTSPPVSLLNWTGNPGPGYNESVVGMPAAGPSFAAAAVAGPSNASSSAYPAPPSAMRMSIDRVGSPLSIVEQRRLHVANAPAPTSPQSAEFDPYTMDNAIAAASAAATTVIPASTPQVDGKGRFTMPQGGNAAPIVHLDGGRIQDALNIGRSATAGPSPPAYEA